MLLSNNIIIIICYADCKGLAEIQQVSLMTKSYISFFFIQPFYAECSICILIDYFERSSGSFKRFILLP